MDKGKGRKKNRDKYKHRPGPRPSLISFAPKSKNIRLRTVPYSTLSLVIQHRWSAQTPRLRHAKMAETVSQEDLEDIRRIAYAAAVWEVENGDGFACTQRPIGDGHPGPVDAKLVRVRLNLGEGETVQSPAGYNDLEKNDFRLDWIKKKHDEDHRLVRWRYPGFGRGYGRGHEFYPSHYIVWLDPENNKLFARIPKPLEGLRRGACDHCWVHDPIRIKKSVWYFDNRSHVNTYRRMTPRMGPPHH